MNEWPDYQMLDFGGGRKLERFGELLVERPCPAAERDKAADRGLWKARHASYSGSRVDDGDWSFAGGFQPPAPLAVPLGADASVRLGVEFSPAGQVGLFPEQFANWRWLFERARRIGPQPHVLNLFAYTGGSTLAAAAAGARVTHVDASKPSVALAKQNAAVSGLAEAPIRWIVEDAMRYCQREVKRGQRYDAVVLDPPSYGHGPKGEPWKLSRDLPKLMSLVGELTGGAPRCLLATCHTPGVGPAELGAYLADGVFGNCAQPAATGQLFLSTAAGRRLESGVFARWPG